MTSSLRLGSLAPDFTAESTHGRLAFHKAKENSWAVLFSHPADYTPVCTTELGAAARLEPEFHRRGVKLFGLSVDDIADHRGWIKDINETQRCDLRFPIIADPNREVARLYDMLDHQDATNVDAKGMPLTVRSVFVLDPKNVIRALITYPASCGRNFSEILRVIDSLQLTDTRKVTTPADWTPGGDVIIHPAVSNEEAEKMFPGYRAVKPYLRLTKLPDAAVPPS